LEHSTTTGSLETTDAEKRRYAEMSMRFNIQNNTFKKLFPQLVQEYIAATSQDTKSQYSSQGNSETRTTTPSHINSQRTNRDKEVIEAIEEVFNNNKTKTSRKKKEDNSWSSILCFLFLCVVIVLVVLFITRVV
jgi:ubiquitin-conjugating enzyme E2 J2